jgi:hypothetical protein
MLAIARVQSPLAFDLAISHTLAAALRVKAAGTCREEDCEVAERLKAMLELRLRQLREPTELSEAIVPTEAMREQLRQTLATLHSLEAEAASPDKDVLEDTVGLLGKLAEKTLSQADAGKLVSLLLTFQSAEHRQPSRPEIALFGVNGFKERGT